MTTIQEANNDNVCWVSIDPVYGDINFYPKEFAKRIEDMFTARNPTNITSCELGKEFFHATVHFHENSIYQTTPATGYSRAGFRSVKRVSNVNTDDVLKLWINETRGEYRLIEENIIGYKICVNAIIRENFIIQSKSVVQEPIEMRVQEPIYNLKIIFDTCPEQILDSCKILKFEISVYNIEGLKYELYALFNEIYCSYPSMFGHFTLYNNYNTNKKNPLLASYDIVSKEIRLMNIFQLDSFLRVSEEKMYVCYR
jgi:hypothetical protein